MDVSNSTVEAFLRSAKHQWLDLNELSTIRDVERLVGAGSRGALRGLALVVLTAMTFACASEKPRTAAKPDRGSPGDVDGSSGPGIEDGGGPGVEDGGAPPGPGVLCPPKVWAVYYPWFRDRYPFDDDGDSVEELTADREDLRRRVAADWQKEFDDHPIGPDDMGGSGMFSLERPITYGPGTIQPAVRRAMPDLRRSADPTAAIFG